MTTIYSVGQTSFVLFIAKQLIKQNFINGHHIPIKWANETVQPEIYWTDLMAKKCTCHKS